MVYCYIYHIHIDYMTVFIDMIYLSFIVYIGIVLMYTLSLLWSLFLWHLGKQRKQRRCQLAPLAVSYPVRFEEFLRLLQSLVYVKTNQQPK